MSPLRSFAESILQPLDLIAAARCLVDAESSVALDARLRRAISTAYYALFHLLAVEAAYAIVERRDTALSEAAWRQAYRALDHGTIRSACLNPSRIDLFSPTFRNIASILPRVQSKRHLADYDPSVVFSHADAAEIVDDCEAAILAFDAAPDAERRAFIAFVLFRTR